MKWECTSGLIQSGETSIDGIIRELNEEIGISVNLNELKLFNTYIEESSNFIRDVYILNKDIPLENFHFNDGEVIDCKYVTKKELMEMAKNNECAFSLDTLTKLSPFKERPFIK
ncbi:MAG: NUDIX domain-containing protein [Clostridia bacterium]|nr:NUDIX domain-containing protein [Clostridia bacterium]